MNPIYLHAESAGHALMNGLATLYSGSPNVITESSRNGAVKVWNGPVSSLLVNPLNRVLFCPLRDANPFFHLFESLWMLGGRNDLPLVAQFNKQMKAYSDDGGETQPAAYGWRWRNHFEYDQLDCVVEELSRDHKTRRAVLTMWDPITDQQAVAEGSSDVPCNTQCYFTIRNSRLDMGVSCRSNDLLWGAHGANLVHFSILLEYIAARVGVQVGELLQFSWNYHLYDNVLRHPAKAVIDSLIAREGYQKGVPNTPIFEASTMEEWERGLPLFLEALKPDVDPGVLPIIRHKFLAGTAMPMWRAWRAHKAKDYPKALEMCGDIVGADWSIACTEWMERRAEKYYARS